MNNWPYTNTHELNLDWILATVKKFEQEYSGIKTALDEAIEAIEQAGADTTEEAIAALNEAKVEIVAAIAEAYRDAIADIPPDFSAVLAAVADTFSTGTYPRNSVVWYDGTLYMFTTNHTGAWTGEDVEEVPLGEYIYNLKINKLDGNTGKNLFDASGIHTPITPGYYKGYDSGITIANVEDEFFTIPCDPSTDYVVNTYNIHVCFYSDELGETYISGFLANPENGVTFTTPNNCYSMTLSIPITSNNTFQVEKGTVPTTYSSYVFGISPRSIIGNCTRYVGPGCEYDTIQKAVTAANSGDIIYILPGTYLEAVDATGKTLHFIGAGRDVTIIQYSGDNYANPPLEIAAGLVENIGFRTTATEPAPGAIDTAYCVHIDYDYSAGKSLQFINCAFESPIRPTVGIGLRENFSLIFTNCNFKSSTFPVYCHEQQASNKIGQRLELVNCTAESTSNSPVIVLQETPTYTGNVVTVLFQRNIVYANGRTTNLIIATTYPGSGTPDGSNYLNTHCFYLDEDSQLNTEPIMNSVDPFADLQSTVADLTNKQPNALQANITRITSSTLLSDLDNAAPNVIYNISNVIHNINHIPSGIPATIKNATVWTIAGEIDATTNWRVQYIASGDNPPELYFRMRMNNQWRPWQKVSTYVPVDNANLLSLDYYNATAVNKLEIGSIQNKNIITFGDSITAGNTNTSWTYHLAAMTGSTIVNKAVAGASFGESLAESSAAYLITQINGVSSAEWSAADLVIVSAGTNDGVINTPHDELKTKVQAAITAIKAATNKPIVFITPIRRNTPTYAENLKLPLISGIISNVALSNDCNVICGYSFPIPSQTIDQITNVTHDGLHPDATGANIYARAVINALT